MLQHDDWLAERIGKAAWRLDPGGDSAEAAKVSGPAFIDTRVPTADIARVAQLSEVGFRLIDTAVTFRHANPGGGTPGTAETAMAAAGDADDIARIAATNFRSDRFHADPAIDDTAADRIKADWARNFFAGARGDWMVVARADGRVAGFLQLLDRDDAVVIDLIAVDAAARNQGLARAMIGFAARSCRPGAPMRVGTQLTNLASIRLYQSLGFELESSEHVMHRHVY